MLLTIEIVLGVLLLLVLLLVVAVVVYRLVAVRRNSTPAVLRLVSRSDWRHGALRYSDTEALFYRLVSLRFGPDLRLQRRSLVLGHRRQPTGADLDVAEDGEMIVRVRGRGRRDEAVEADLCLAPPAITALLAWVEACSTEQVRRPGRPDRKRR